MSKVLSPEAALGTNPVLAAEPQNVEASASCLNGYALIAHLGYPSALASNPVLEANDSSPWLQSRVVCNNEVPHIPAEQQAPPVERGLFTQIFSFFRSNPETEPFPQRVSGPPEIYVDLGLGATATFPIGTLMPLHRDWRWNAPEHLSDRYSEVLLETYQLPRQAETPVEPAFNEADDEMPSWINLDRVEYRRGALMGRRRSPHGG
jgi:hypothetical protein